MPADWVTRIDALLPQTQCTRCGYPTCRAYAEAIAANRADIDRCPPGGAEGIAAMAALLGVAPKPLDPSTGVEGPPLVAVIDEDICIGCTKCIQACPVDAIVGASKVMHTILVDECTGCELCIPPCPVDCIRMEVTPLPADPPRYRSRYHARLARLALEEAERGAELAARKESLDAASGAAVRAAIARARARKRAGDA